MKRHLRLPTDAVTYAFVVLASVFAGWTIGDEELAKIAIAGVLLVAIVALSIRTPRRMISVLVVWVAILGLVRRITTGGRVGGLVDPLLVILPVALGLLMLAAFTSARLRQKTRLSSLVLLTQAIVLASAVNPLQGSVTGGIVAVLFLVVPMSAFWIGRALCDDETYGRVLRTVAVMSVVAAAYGLFQTFRGFPPWDEQWIQAFGVGSLQVPGAIRSFSMFSSSSEYATFLSMGIIAWTSARRVRWMAPGLAVAGFLLAALLFAGSRGPIVIVMIAAGVTIVARLGLRIDKAIIAGAIAALLLPSLVGAIAPKTFAQDSSGRLLAHQVEGLTDPFGEKSSLNGHIDLLQRGLGDVLTHPLGRGFGAVSYVGARLGAENEGTEADPSNMAVGAGWPGLLAYVALVVATMRRSYRLVRERGGVAPIAALGLLIVTGLHWFTGGQYAVCWLVWLTIGWIDRATEADEPEATRPDQLALSV